MWWSSRRIILIKNYKIEYIQPKYIQKAKKRDDFRWISRVFSNLILAAIGFLLYNRLSVLPEIVLLCFNKFFLAMLTVNMVLCAFNLIPIPPLGGSIIYMSTLIAKKSKIAKELADYGVRVLVFLVVLMPLIGTLYGKDYNVISLYMKWFIK